jgi:hypothetical protein
MGGVLHAWRTAGLWLALIALALRVAVPVGFMLAPDSHNRLTVTLCSGHGPVTAQLDLTTGEISTDHKPVPSPSDKGKADAPCTFAAMSVAIAGPPPAIGIPAPRALSVSSSRAPLVERPSLQPVGPPLPARGPPQRA